MKISEIEIENPNEMVDIAEKVLEFKKQKQTEQGLKILTKSNVSWTAK